MSAAAPEPQLVQVKLLSAPTAVPQKGHIISANVVIDDLSLLPYIDDTSSAIISMTQSERRKSAEWPRLLRYYAVGPGTYRIKCPLCSQPGDAAVMKNSIGDLSCCLSRVCCLKYPGKGIYCNKCGGKLGTSK